MPGYIAAVALRLPRACKSVRYEGIAHRGIYTGVQREAGTTLKSGRAGGRRMRAGLTPKRSGQGRLHYPLSPEGDLFNEWCGRGIHFA